MVGGCGVVDMVYKVYNCGGGENITGFFLFCVEYNIFIRGYVK